MKDAGGDIGGLLAYCADSQVEEIRHIVVKSLGNPLLVHKCRVAILNSPSRFAPFAGEIAGIALKSSDLSLLCLFGDEKHLSAIQKLFVQIKEVSRQKYVEMLCRPGLGKKLVDFACFLGRNSKSRRIERLSKLTEMLNGAKDKSVLASLCANPPTKNRHVLEYLFRLVGGRWNVDMAVPLRKAVESGSETTKQWREYAIRLLVKNGEKTGNLTGYFVNSPAITTQLDPLISVAVMQNEASPFVLDEYFRSRIDKAVRDRDFFFPWRTYTAAAISHTRLLTIIQGFKDLVVPGEVGASLAEAYANAYSQRVFVRLPVFLPSSFWKAFSECLDSNWMLQELQLRPLVGSVRAARGLSLDGYRKFEKFIRALSPKLADELSKDTQRSISALRKNGFYFKRYLWEMAFEDKSALPMMHQWHLSVSFLSTGAQWPLEFLPDFNVNARLIRGASICLDALASQGKAGTVARCIFWDVCREAPCGPLLKKADIEHFYGEMKVIAEKQGITLFSDIWGIMIVQSYPNGRMRMIGDIIWPECAELQRLDVDDGLIGIRVKYDGEMPGDFKKKGKDIWAMTLNLETAPLKDSDMDGLGNSSELKMRTNPRMPDTDNDSLLDGEDPYPLDKNAELEFELSLMHILKRGLWIPFSLTADNFGEIKSSLVTPVFRFPFKRVFHSTDGIKLPQFDISKDGRSIIFEVVKGVSTYKILITETGMTVERR